MIESPGCQMHPGPLNECSKRHIYNVITIYLKSVASTLLLLLLDRHHALIGYEMLFDTI